MANGVNATFRRRLRDDREHRGQRCVRRDAPARLIEHRAERDRRQDRAESEETAGDQLAFRAEKMCRSDRQYRTCESECGGCARVHCQPHEQKQRSHTAALQEYLRNALEYPLNKIDYLERACFIGLECGDNVGGRQRSAR